MKKARAKHATDITGLTMAYLPSPGPPGVHLCRWYQRLILDAMPSGYHQLSMEDTTQGFPALEKCLLPLPQMVTRRKRTKVIHR